MEKISNYSTKIFENNKFAISITLILFFVTHAPFFLGRYANEDYHHVITGRKNNIMLGRFLGNIYPKYSIPWVLGFICALLLTVSTCLLLSFFHIQKKFSIILISASIVTFPTLAYTFGYLYQTDMCCISICASCLAVWIVEKHPLGFLLGSVFLMISLAEYQSYIGVAMTLCVLKIVLEIIRGNIEDKKLLGLALKYVMMGMLGLVLYFVGVRISLMTSGIVLAEYKGVNTMGKIPFNQIPQLLVKTYTRFISFFIGKTFFYTSPIVTILYALNFICAINLGLAIFRNQNVKSFRQRLAAIFILVVLLPLCCNPIDFIAPESTASTLSIYAVVCLPIFTVVLASENAAKGTFEILRIIILFSASKFYL